MVLAHAALVGALRGDAPLLLLDEPLVHLDRTRRDALFAALERSTSQVLLTGTDLAPFRPLLEQVRGQAASLRAEQGRLLDAGLEGGERL